MSGSQPTQPPLSLHDHIEHAERHIQAALDGINLNDAYRTAAFDGRITNYGNRVITADRLRRIQRDLQELNAKDQAQAVSVSAAGHRPLSRDA